MTTERVPAAVRRVVAERAGRRCEYCQTPADFSTQSFTVEHILPRAEGGLATLDNLAWACFGCNAHKHTAVHAADPQTGETVPLFHPRRQNWHDHFEWSGDLTEIVGKTASGRATVVSLRMNRPGLVNLRQVLTLAGEHPPRKT